MPGGYFPNTAGAYREVVNYGGDADNQAASGVAAEQVVDSRLT